MKGNGVPFSVVSINSIRRKFANADDVGFEEVGKGFNVPGKNFWIFGNRGLFRSYGSVHDGDEVLLHLA
jgi:hypothetical protein